MSRRGPSRIHQGLTRGRALVGSEYLADAELRREYDADIAPRTRAALARVFASLPAVTVGRALDLGAGTGAAGEAIRARFPDAALVSVDKVGGPGIIAGDVTRGTRPRGVEGRFDLIVAAHLLNELPLSPEDRAALVDRWCGELLADDGLLVLLEPALRETSRALLAVRDRLLTRGLTVLAPCFFRGPCPALTRERDWCHDSAPAIVAGRSRVDFSYLVLARGGAAAPDDRYRTVSDPMEEKGRLRLFVCGAGGRTPLVRLHRDRTEANRALDDAARGDVLHIEGAATAGDGLRVGAETTVRRG